MSTACTVKPFYLIYFLLYLKTLQVIKLWLVALEFNMKLILGGFCLLCFALSCLLWLLVLLK